jgi:hypothetical protein
VSEEPARSVPLLHDLFAALERHAVDFVVIGGIAGLAHGSSYPSFDLDVAYSREKANLERLVGALKELSVSLRGAPADLPFQLDVRTLQNGANFTFATPYGDFDILADIRGIRSYDSLRANAERKRIAGHEIFVASIDDLITMKRAANRPKDRLMLENYLVIADEQQRLVDGRDQPE